MYRKRTYKPRRKARTIKRRAVRKFRKVYHKSKAVSRVMFPMVKYTALRFADYKVLTSTDTWQTYTYRLNSCYDPDFTGIGGQPRYFDTLCGPDSGAAPYGAYRVHAAKVTVGFVNANSSGNSTGIVAIRARNQNAAALNPSTANMIRDCSEVPNTRWRWITSSGNDGCRRTLTGYWKMNKFYGVKDIKDNEDFTARYNANPSDEIYLDCHFGTVNASSTAYNCQVSVKITYFVELLERNLPAAS